MKRILSIIVLISLLLFALTSCGAKITPTVTGSCTPEHNYFNYYDNKDKKKLLTTLTSQYSAHNMVFGFVGLISSKLISIEDDNPNAVKVYMQYGRGTVNNVNESNVACYKVTFEDKYLPIYLGYPYQNGEQTTHFTLIKENNKGPWLIDEMGE